MTPSPQQTLSTNAVIKCVAYADGHKLGSVELDDISDVLATEKPFIWIGVYEPNSPLLRKLQEEFTLHDLAVEDALRAHQRPKLEEYGDSIFVVLRTVEYTGENLTLGETHLFVGPRYVVSVRHGTSISYAPVRERCERMPQFLSKGPGFVLYAIMDFVVDHYFPVVDTMEDKLDEIEEDVFSKQFDRQTTHRIYALKRDLMALKRAISPLIDVCNRLMRFDIVFVHEDVRPYFRDVYDHVIRINESIDSLREMLSAALEANLALISVGQNEVMKKLGSYAAIFAVPTMIAGVYGMNFDFMPELHWWFGYPLSVGLMLAASGWLYTLFKRAKWL